MMRNPVVSVIIPTKNRSHLLVRAFQSVIKQNYNDIEVIIIDDCSSDNTQKIISDLKNEYSPLIRSYRFSKTAGAAPARQKGIEMSTGRFIAFLDDDDEWLPEKLNLQIRALKDNQELGSVTSWYFRNNGNNNKNIKVKLAENIKSRDILWSNILGSFSFVMVRKELFNNNIINTNLKSCQDWDFWIQVLKNTSVGIIQEYLAIYNDHNENRITLNYSNKIDGLNELLTINKSIMSENQKLYISAKMHDYISISRNIKFYKRIRSKIYSVSIYYKLGHPDYTTFSKLIYTFIKFFTPKLIISIYKNSFNTIKSISTEIHHEKELSIVRNNLNGNNYLKSNQSSEIIYL